MRIKCRTLIACLFLLLFSDVCLSQTSYKGITPGKSRKVEVDRVLGQPVKQLSETLVEYRPQPLAGRIYVQYRAVSGVVERIEFICRLPDSNCNDFTKSLNLNLPPTGQATTPTDEKGRYLAFNEPPHYVVETMDEAGELENNQMVPVRIAFYSRELYEAEVTKAKKASEAETATTKEESTPKDRDGIAPIVGATIAPKTSCFEVDPGIGSTSRDEHYRWAQQIDSTQLMNNLASKIGILFNCQYVSADQLARGFGQMSGIIGDYVSNPSCFSNDPNVTSRDRGAHEQWARTKTRDQVRDNLQWKTVAAMKCLKRDNQLAFFADESVALAKIPSGGGDGSGSITRDDGKKPPALSGGYGEVTGIVKLRAADGSLQPIANATVHFYRTDLPNHVQTRTDSHGIFQYVGLMQTATWVVVVSGPGLKWAHLDGVRPPVAGLEIIAEPGDGSVPTSTDVTNAIKKN